MADIVAGGSTEPVSVGLAVDTRQWEAGMDRAKKALDRSAAAMEQRLAKTSDKIKEKSKESGKAMERFSGAFGGGLAGGIAGGVAAGGIMGILTKIGEGGGAALKEVALGLDRVNERAWESQRALARFSDSIERANKKSAESLDSIVDPGAKLAELDKQIREAGEQAGRFDNAALRITQKTDEIGGAFSSDGWQLWLGGKFGDAGEHLKKQLEGASTAAETFRKRMLDLRDARKKLLSAKDNDLFKGALNKFIDDLNIKTDTIDLSPLEQQVAALGRQFNALPRDIEAALQAAKKFNAVQKEFDLSKQFDELTKSLRMEREAIGLTADELKYLDAIGKGFNETQLEGIKKQIDELGRLRKAFEMGNAFDEVLQGLAAERAAIGKTATEIKIMELAAKGFGFAELGVIGAKLKQIEDLKNALDTSRKTDAMLGGSKEAVNVITNAARAGANQPGGMPGANMQQGNAMLKVMLDIAGKMNVQNINAQNALNVFRQIRDGLNNDDGLFAVDD